MQATDSELLGFLISSMQSGMSLLHEDCQCWHLESLPGETPREAIEDAYAEYRQQLIEAEKNPLNSL